MYDLLWGIFEIGINLFESCVVIHFICAFLHHDFSTFKGKMIFVVGAIMDFICVTIINQFTVYEGILGAVYIFEYFIFTYIFLKGSIVRKVFVSVISPTVMISVNIIVSSIISTAFKSDLQIIYFEKSVERILMIVFVQIFLICVYDLILKYMVTSLKKSEWKLVLSILGISFVCIAYIRISLINSNVDTYYARIIMVAEVGIIILNIVCFYMTYALSRSNVEAEELRMQQQQEAYRVQYAENIRLQYEEVRRMRHDMKQNLAVISTLYKEKKYSEAEGYAGKLSDNLEMLDIIVDVGNDFINAILNSKLSIAKERKIEIICTTSKNIIGIEDIDLCNLLGNMLDNAIESAEKCENGLIEVSINADNDKVLVIIANSINESVLERNSNLLSTKNENANHGYGVKTIKSIAQKYNGVATFYEEEKMFYCQVLMYKNKM